MATNIFSSVQSHTQTCWTICVLIFHNGRLLLQALFYYNNVNGYTEVQCAKKNTQHYFRSERAPESRLHLSRDRRGQTLEHVPWVCHLSTHHKVLVGHRLHCLLHVCERERKGGEREREKERDKEEREERERERERERE